MPPRPLTPQDIAICGDGGWIVTENVPGTGQVSHCEWPSGASPGTTWEQIAGLPRPKGGAGRDGDTIFGDHGLRTPRARRRRMATLNFDRRQAASGQSHVGFCLQTCEAYGKEKGHETGTHPAPHVRACMSRCAELTWAPPAPAQPATPRRRRMAAMNRQRRMVAQGFAVGQHEIEEIVVTSRRYEGGATPSGEEIIKAWCESQGKPTPTGCRKYMGHAAGEATFPTKLTRGGRVARARRAAKMQRN